MPDEYLVRTGYAIRRDPTYFHDDQPGVTWQPEVYTHAGEVAAAFGCRRIIDVGCGNGDKLVALADRFEVTGIDFGPNIDLCRARHTVGTWVEFDVASEASWPASIDFVNATVVCADVIEHLLQPERLVAKLVSALEDARALLLSTPERHASYSGHTISPPPNTNHVREWTMRELIAFLRRAGLQHGSFGLTRSNDKSTAWHAVLLGYVADPADLPLLEETLIDAYVPELPPLPVNTARADATRLARRIAAGVRRRLIRRLPPS